MSREKDVFCPTCEIVTRHKRSKYSCLACGTIPVEPQEQEKPDPVQVEPIGDGDDILKIITRMMLQNNIKSNSLEDKQFKKILELTESLEQKIEELEKELSRVKKLKREEIPHCLLEPKHQHMGIAELGDKYNKVLSELSAKDAKLKEAVELLEEIKYELNQDEIDVSHTQAIIEKFENSLKDGEK